MTVRAGLNAMGEVIQSCEEMSRHYMSAGEQTRVFLVDRFKAAVLAQGESAKGSFYFLLDAPPSFPLTAKISVLIKDQRAHVLTFGIVEAR